MYLTEKQKINRKDDKDERKEKEITKGREEEKENGERQRVR